MAAGSLLSMPKEELLDSLGSLYHLLQREGQWMAKEGGKEGMCAVNAALLAALHMLQVWQRACTGLKCGVLGPGIVLLNPRQRLSIAKLVVAVPGGCFGVLHTPWPLDISVYLSCFI